ncbi:hypothetical protein [Gordonia oryzae]|uniref:hypothetical protein n=1 Tax=Gordonia oryzae TaxID=2487349 RepID=UPI000F4D301B|nr:hypothetical protein [Gordonia oryzae]
MGAKSGKRGKRPAAPADGVGVPTEPRNHNAESPKFCLKHLVNDFDVKALDQERVKAFAETLQRLCALTWNDLGQAPRKGLGYEQIPKHSIKPSIPQAFEDSDKFMVFRYCGQLPMAGVRVRDVFHVVWIEPEFNKLYDHGSS